MNGMEQLANRPWRPSTPGDLLEDWLEDAGVSQEQLAQAIGVSRATINRLIRGHHHLTADMAHRLGIFFGNGPGLWLRLQQAVDMWDALHVDMSLYAGVKSIKELVGK